MEYLYCGWCCTHISPISHPRPCPYIIRCGTFVFCGNYKKPEQYIAHLFDTRFCPIGLDVLELTDIDMIRDRIDTGHYLIQEMLMNK